MVYNVSSFYGSIVYMDIRQDTLKKEIRELLKLGFIAPEDIPSIELYMDQVTTFMDKHLEVNKRYDEDKTLTKTMINNYTKNDLLPPPNKKRYSKEHIILLIYIYYLKNIMSINDIQTMLMPLIENCYDNPEAEHTLEELYTRLYKLEQHQYFNIENSVVKACKIVENNVDDSEGEYVKNFMYLCLLAYDIFSKKKLMEKIIDDMASEQDDKE